MPQRRVAKAKIARSQGSTRARPPQGSTLTRSQGGTLACPLYKDNPLLHKSCALLRLKRPKHVKKHLLDNHRLLISCPRCARRFKNDKGRSEHVRAGPCVPPSPDEVWPQGLDLKQVAELAKYCDRTDDLETQMKKIRDIVLPHARDHPVSPFTTNHVDELITGPIANRWRTDGVALSTQAWVDEGLPLDQAHHAYRIICRAFQDVLGNVLADNAKVDGRERPDFDLFAAPAAAVLVPDAGTPAASVLVPDAGTAVVQAHDTGAQPANTCVSPADHMLGQNGEVDNEIAEFQFSQGTDQGPEHHRDGYPQVEYPHVEYPQDGYHHNGYHHNEYHHGEYHYDGYHHDEYHHSEYPYDTNLDFLGGGGGGGGGGGDWGSRESPA